MSLYRTIAACRACDSSALEEVLSLGELAISDFPADPGAPADRAPLTLVQCQDCTLVQLRHTVNRDRLYRNYFYRSGTNEAMVAALKDVASEAMRHVQLQPDDVVLDIGANDCTLLQQFPETVLRAGFEPADDVRCTPDGACDPILFRTYFPPARPWAVWLPAQPRIICSIAMFYDVDEPNAFVAAIKEWLHPEGVWVLQFQDLGAMLALNAFDNMCHEHLTYWSVWPLRRLLERHGLRIADLRYNATNGGSMRVFVRHGPVRPPEPPPTDPALAYRMRLFAEHVESLRDTTVALLIGLAKQGERVLGYGASTKGNTLLQYYGITPEVLPAIAERNPEKWGRFTAGSNIPIISEDEMRGREPTHLFALPWHFAEGFRAREREFAERGGQWIIPLPKLRVLDGDGDACVLAPDTPAESWLGLHA